MQWTMGNTLSTCDVSRFVIEKVAVMRDVVANSGCVGAGQVGYVGPSCDQATVQFDRSESGLPAAPQLRTRPLRVTSSEFAHRIYGSTAAFGPVIYRPVHLFKLVQHMFQLF